MVRSSVVRFSLKPKRLCSSSELVSTPYSIVESAASIEVEVVPLLGSVANSAFVERCFREHLVDVVSQLLMHVPLVEVNPLVAWPMF